MLFAIRSRRPGLFAAIVAATVLAAASQPRAAQAEAAESVVLLTNGNVLSGQLQEAGDRYRLIGQGSEVQIAKSRVAYIGPTLASIYEWRRGRLSDPTAGDMLQLAAWCIRQDLWPQAAQQLLEARSADPEHPHLSRIEKRLQERWRREQSTPPVSAEPPIDDQLAEAARAAQQLRVLSSLPEGALEQFTRRVQPILVNNCTTSGCHRTGGEREFQLNRQWVHGLADRRSTFANLAATLAMVDRGNPAASRLLAAAGGPHAGAPGGLLTGRKAELHDRVAEWAWQVSQPAAPPTPRQPRPVQMPTYAGLIGGGFRSVPPVGRTAPPPQRTATAPTPTNPPEGGGVNPRQTDSAVQPAGYQTPAAPQPPTATRDEFDPAIFNEQFGP